MTQPKLCGASTPNGPCQSDILMANGRCKMHGGPTPAGVASPHWKHGKYSKHLPSRLAERYEELRADSEITANHDALALLDVRIGDVLQGLDTGESGELWTALGFAATAIRRLEREANKEPNEEKAQELAEDREKAIENLLLLIDQGINERAIWGEVLGLFERRRKLATAETQRLQVLKLMVPVAEVVAMRAAIASVIRTHVSDPDTLRALVADLDRVAAGPTAGA